MKRPFAFLILSLIFLLCPGSLKARNKDWNPSFRAIAELAEEGLERFNKGLHDEETLSILQEAWVRGSDWVNLPSDDELRANPNEEIIIGDDGRLMGDVVGAVFELRKKLRNESDQELLLLIFDSAISNVTREDHTFENIPNIYPDFNEIAEDPEVSLSEAVDLMAQGKMKEAEKILLILYYDTWINKNNPEHKYKAANKLGLLYLRLQLSKKCLELLRQSKIEMEQLGILNEDYVETLVYTGYAQLLENPRMPKGKMMLEVADYICEQHHFDPESIISDYRSVINPSPLGDDPILHFIRANDKNFFFLTEKERLMRWKNISYEWENLKTGIYDTHSDNINSLLNAFQYEKQILLRSALKVKDVLADSGDPQALEMLDSLLKVKMLITTPEAYGEKYERMEADYQRIQKYLMHHPALDRFDGSLYIPVTTNSIASKLRDDETFIDFGKISERGSYSYVAIIITRDNPNGEIVKLPDVDSLRDFIAQTEADDAKTMTRNRYDNDWLYTNIWLPVEETGLIRDRVFYCPSDELNVIMPDAIKKGDEFLGESIEFHILSSAEALEKTRTGENYMPERILSLGGMKYVGDREKLISIAQYFGSTRPIRRHSLDVDKENYLIIDLKTSLIPVDTPDDYNWLTNLRNKTDCDIIVFTGEESNEYLFKHLPAYGYEGALSIFTHAFNLPRDYYELGNHYVLSESLREAPLEKGTNQLLPLYRTGLMLSGAERSWTGRNFIDGIEDGILNGEEISSLDLSGLELVTLLACSTGAGDVDEYEGIIGIRRALKMAGCGTLVTTAWNLDREAAMAYMQIFYTGLLDGYGVQKSHRKAQLELIKRFEDPYYWALFQLID